MRFAPCLIVAASVCLALVGCSSANRRPNAGGDGVFLGAGPQASTRRAEPTDPLSGSSGIAPDLDGMLAGQVLDRATGRPISATIRCVCLDDPKSGGEGTEAATTDAQGHYVIQGLKAGKHYKLIARARADGRVLIGVQYTMAPNSRAVIALQEDLSAPRGGEAAPPPPAPPAAKAAEPDPKKAAALRTPERPASAQVAVPAWGAPTVGAVPVPNPNAGSAGLSIRTPVPVGPGELPAAGDRPPWDRPPQSPWPRPGVPTAPERIADGQTRPWQPPITSVPGGQRPQAVPNLPLSPAPVPSCVLVGEQLVNFALYDLSGQAWEYRSQKRGKLMLVDFWSTTCVPCLKTLPYLQQFQDRYGSLGLRVVGIAYENTGPPPEQARRVGDAAQRYKVGYTQLLGGGARCPVKTQFGVKAYPTLLLISDNGWILWRHEGQLDGPATLELERRIGMWLGTN